MTDDTLAKSQEELNELLPHASPEWDAAMERVSAEAKAKRTYPTGTTRPNRAKSHRPMSIRLDQECYDYLAYLVGENEAEDLTGAIEQCIRFKRDA